MEGHTIIHANAFGYISRCNCCKDLQLCIGNIVLVFGRNDFMNFKSSFFELNDIDMARLHRKGRMKRYTIMTSYSDLTLSLSRREFELTSDLLNMAEVNFLIEEELKK